MILNSNGLKGAPGQLASYGLERVMIHGMSAWHGPIKEGLDP
jgi:hypothetical protein